MRRLLKIAIMELITPLISCLKILRKYKEAQHFQSQSSPRILLIACHWIGDTLWAAQVVPVLRSRWPSCYLGCVTKPVCSPIWSGGLAVDQCIPSNAVVSDRQRENVNWPALYRLGRQLRQQRWDLVIDLTGNRYSAMLSHWVCAQSTLGFAGDELGGLYATCVKDAERSGQHLSERPFRVIEPLLDDFVRLESLIAPAQKQTYAQACQRYGLSPEKALAVIAPSAGWPEKEWGDTNFARLIGHLSENGYHVALVDSPDKKTRLAAIAAAQKDSPPPVSIVAEASMDAAIAFVSGCTIFIGNDSGLGHIAAAMGRKCVSVFTSETQPVACRPLGKHAVVISAEDDDKTLGTILEYCNRAKSISA